MEITAEQGRAGGFLPGFLERIYCVISGGVVISK
jgi:hypothetical protein